MLGWLSRALSVLLLISAFQEPAALGAELRFD